jgi:hypothetical protein
VRGGHGSHMVPVPRDCLRAAFSRGRVHGVCCSFKAEGISSFDELHEAGTVDAFVDHLNLQRSRANILRKRIAQVVEGEGA